MDLQKLREKPHLSASSITAYIDCSLQYKIKRVDHVKSEFVSEALLFGTAIHKVLADFYQERMSGNNLVISDLENLFETYWTEITSESENIKYSPGKDFTACLNEGKGLLAAYITGLPDNNYRCIGIEESFSFKVDGVPIPIIGAIDLIEEDIETGAICVTDFKTANRAYSWEDVVNNFQLTVYNLAMLKNGFTGRDIFLRFDVLIKNKIPKFEQIYVTRTETDFIKATNKIRQVYEAMKHEVYIANLGNWKCKGCEVQTTCEEIMSKEV